MCGKAFDDEFGEFEARAGEIEAYLEQWSRLEIPARAPDRARTESAITRVYHHMRLREPRVVWCESLWQLVALNLTWSTKDKFALAYELRDFFREGIYHKLWSSLIKLIESQDLEDTFARAAGDRSYSAVIRQTLNRRIKAFVEEFQGYDQMPKTAGVVPRIRAKFRTDVSPEAIQRRQSQTHLIEERTVTHVLDSILRLEFERLAGSEESFGPRSWLITRLPELGANGPLRVANNGTMFVPDFWFNDDIPDLPGGVPESVAGVGKKVKMAVFLSSELGLWYPQLETSDLAALFCVAEIFESQVLGDSGRDEVRAWADLARECFVVQPGEQMCIVCYSPAEIFRDENGEFHHSSRSAVSLRDGLEVFCWHGRLVPRKVVLQPELLSVEDIELEENVETRRIMIERYGIERYLTDSRAEKIAEDECGTLYQRKDHPFEPFTVVMVKNSTLEPDGSSKHYFLIVPPDMRTARQAVAWTFGMTEHEYRPAEET